MAKYRIYIYFLGIMFFYFIVRFIRIVFPNAPDFVRYHLTDLLFIPAMALFALIFARLIKRDKKLTIQPFLLFFQTSIIALYFEIYLPFYSPRAGEYTSDMIDVMMYFIGAILFLLLQKRL